MAEKKQRSLFWIITTAFLTTAFSGGIFGVIFISIGKIVASGLPETIGILVNALLWLAGILLGVKIAVNFVGGRAFIKREDIPKVSTSIALLPIIPVILVLILALAKGGVAIFGKMGLVNFSGIIITVGTALIIFYAAQRFLSKKIQS